MNARGQRGRGGVMREGTGYVDTERLRGGGDPDAPLPELNPRKLAEMIINRPPHPPEGSGIDPDRTDYYGQTS